MKACLDGSFEMGLLKVFHLQFDPAARAHNRFAIRGRKDFFFLKDPSADVKKMPARMLFIQRI